MLEKEMNFRKGRLHEQRALAYLQEKGFQLLECNYRFHRNEIDLIMLDRRRQPYAYVFVEVKSRSSRLYGDAYTAVNYRKQQSIRAVALHYLQVHQLSLYHTPCRFDVVCFDEEKISHYENAF